MPVPGRDGPRKTRSTPERTLVLELVSWGGWGGLRPRSWGLTLLPTLQEGTLVCSSVLAGWRQGATATFTTVFQGDSYKVGAHVLGLGQRGAGSRGGAQRAVTSHSVCLSSVPVSFRSSQRGTGPQGLKSRGREWPRDPWDPAWGAGPPSWGSPWCQDMGAGGFLGLPGDAVPFQVHVKLRPHVQQFLESLSNTYEVPVPPCSPGVCGEPAGCFCIWGGVGSLRRDLRLLPQIFIFTTAKQDYAEKVLDVLGPQKKLIR